MISQANSMNKKKTLRSSFKIKENLCSICNIESENKSYCDNCYTPLTVGKKLKIIPCFNNNELNNQDFLLNICKIILKKCNNISLYKHFVDYVQKLWPESQNKFLSELLQIDSTSAKKKIDDIFDTEYLNLLRD